MKKIFIQDMATGNILLKEPFVINEITEDRKVIRVLLSDRTGMVDAVLLKNDNSSLALVKENLGGVFLITGPVLKKDGQVKVREVKIREIEIAHKFLPHELYEGLTNEKKQDYISEIKALFNKVIHKGYRSLLDACLSDDVLNKLAEYPATHGFYGVYIGGALAATCTVTYMAINCAVAYVKRGNGISTQPPDWSLLITASLLHQVGRLAFFDPNDPFKKSPRGVAMNYFSTLQSLLEEVIREHEIPLTEMEIAMLLNVLNVATSNRTSTRSVSKDGTILRSVLRLYGECDAYDWCVANAEVDEGATYVYDGHTNRYYLSSVINPEERKEF